MRDKFVRRAVTAQPVTRSSPRQPMNSPTDRPQTTKEMFRPLQVEKKEVEKQENKQDIESAEASTPVAKSEDNSLLLKGKSVIFSETDKSITMETIPEEQSSYCLLATTPPIPASDERKQTSHDSPKQEKKSPTNIKLKCEPSGESLSNEQETQVTPLSAKVLLKNQLSQSEQQDTIQPTIGRGKR